MADMIAKNWKIGAVKNRTLRNMLSVSAVAGAAFLISGCNLISPPDPEPEPQPVSMPKPGAFNASDYTNHGVELNSSSDKNLPTYFDAESVDAADLLRVRSIHEITVNNQPQASVGSSETVRIAGIVTPQQGQPGWHEAVQTIQNWTLGQKLTIEQDPKYPLDSQRRRRVQVFFTGRDGGELAGQTLNLNRMLVRSGYAVVDLTQPTIFDTKGWLNDEQYARERHLGLWGMGILLDHRLPPPALLPEGVTGDTAPQQVRSSEEAEDAEPPL